jgi:hypothetical protein
MKMARNFDLIGTYALDENQRIDRQFARIEHQEEAIAFAEEQPAETQFSYPEYYLALLREEVELLRPYWGPGVTKQQAVEAYRAKEDA